MQERKEFSNTVVSKNSVIEVEGGKSDKNSRNLCTIYLHSSGEHILVIEIPEKEISTLGGMLELFNHKLFH